MKTFKIKTKYKKLLADTLTPVSLYLRLRDKYADSILLESSDYHGSDNSMSYICCSPMASFIVEGKKLKKQYPDLSKEESDLQKGSLVKELEAFKAAFNNKPHDFKFSINGLFGYMSYDAVQEFEDIAFKNENEDIPTVMYRMYRFVIVIDHFKNELYLFEHQLENEEDSQIDTLVSLIKRHDDPQFGFEMVGEESSNYNDETFLEIIKNGQNHCLRGDVFQIVLSRRFQKKFKGDEFNVYRALRSINPSPYLFYFDYGGFKIFGSSPESQITISNNKATIYPIAGTFRRTGDDTADAELAKKLSEDEKENAEHIMLVDLARNDLSRSAENVKVEVFKEIQYYSHVIHLVSKVSGDLSEGDVALQLVGDTFPAGTLSGAPKYKAMQLIDQYENRSRSYYGGAIGFLGFNGEFNHAIMIRSFLSKNNVLHYQAGAGVVAKSVPESELKEVDNKLAALRNAMNMAQTINGAS
ncbi:anthranilate synthase component I family protein [Fulvivirga lutimaris]|uniref:anthranilate synthase component I family protein n=1 Tax=Fulvivirga lutimaris TaxID=1819566 RepID=UPI0012BC8371|nr:anthranilate synthase component I family protein [Fulvivirga lutimaris]MTI38956.1 anthranilate synthase component I family protein [Fulvivirga lutimaris]